jgi:hypothetical protein
MTTTITIKDKAINTTYQNITGLTGGSGDGAAFDVVKTNGIYTASLDALAASAGTGYVAGDTITIPGANLGGATPTNNLILTVGTVGLNGKIATFGQVGVGRVGDGTVDVQVDVTGTTGVDTYTLNGASTEFTVTKAVSGITAVSVLSPTVTFALADHERVVFSDKAVAFDATGTGVAGDVYALLAASIGVSDITAGYEGIGIALVEQAGWTKLQLAQAILNTDVYKNDAGGVSNETFVRQVFNNVVGRAATTAEVTAFVAEIDKGTFTQASLLVLASELTAFETTIGLTGLATTGIDYTPITL